MTDREAFERVMELMGMELKTQICVEQGELVVYEDSGNNTKTFTTEGYDVFYAGAIFRGDGVIERGYLDSHVAFRSDNHKAILAEMTS